MPIQPGILLSSLLAVACLGMNLALYPEVREMVRAPNDRATSTPAPAERSKTDSKPSYPKLEKTPPAVPPVEESAKKPEPPLKSAAKPEKEPEKVSKVNRPIPVPVVPDSIDKKESEKKPEKKAEPEKKAAETPPPKKEPKKVEPEPVKKKETEEKPPEKKPEPPPQKPEKKVDPKPVEKPVEKPAEKKAEPVKAPKDESYGLPSVFPLETSTTSKKKDADAFQPLVPAELEKEYRDSEGKTVNQFQLFPMRALPNLEPKSDGAAPAAPVYAEAYKPEAVTPIRRLPEVETPTADEVKPRKERKPPKAVWNTVETIMESPIVYE